MSKTYAIGDAHGRFDLVCAAISLAEADAGSEPATFVVCGDFIDRGPQSRQIIDLLMAGPPLPNWSWVVIAGNHEDIMLQCITKRNLRWWVGNGGGATLESYGYVDGDNLLPLKVPQEHLDWLSALPLYHLDQHRAFVHAAFDPRFPLAEQSQHFLQWHYDPMETDYGPFLGRHVVCGHVQHADGPILTENRSNLDTYAWRFGTLAVAVFDDAVPGGPQQILWATGPEA